MAGARRVCWADWSEEEDEDLGPWANFASGHSGDAEAVATAAVYDDDPAVAQSAKKQGKRKKRKGAKSSAPQAMSQERPSSPSRPAAAPQPVGPVGNVRHRKNNCLDCLQQAGSSGVGSCEGAFRFRSGSEALPVGQSLTVMVLVWLAHLHPVLLVQKLHQSCRRRSTSSLVQ